MAKFSYIRLNSGKKFDYSNLSLDSICIQDIAHSLSLQCRYVGHCEEFYSVAQHSVLVSRLLPQPLKFQGLMHDAAEAYLGDMNTALKALCPDYQKLEKAVESLCMAKFGINYPFNREIKNADMRLLTTELRDFMPGEDYKVIKKEFPPLEEELIPWGSTASHQIFIEEFNRLYVK